ncbi:phosphatidate cytidylyltransferase [Tilletia horrida]|uniref:Phosphatidate cytidylyltransferase n=1 Tax=Tilletia horrida TaxID=155126 RepID=A0AAN6GRP9_9BASI|nr:phosphatidate cytidylyltransferase [Tilletia horrida]KAK0570221.1 phosphatidate cytidylyltransferase [Tilletia horrida]
MAPKKSKSKTQAAQPSAAEALEQALEQSQQIIDKGVADGKKQVRQVKAKVNSSQQDESKAFWKKVRDRTVFTFIMIGGFVGLLLMGHPYMILLVTALETMVYREVVGLFNLPSRPHVTATSKKGSGAESAVTSAAPSDDEDEDDTITSSRRKEELWSKTLSWYFFSVANYFLYGESLIYYFKHIVFVDAYFLPFASKHRLLSFLLYTFGFVAFVSGLKRANLKRQFGLFCWVHMSLLLIVFSSHFMVNNILEGLIWFWLPASLVICNDVFAYVCGMLFGRTPLISLSPKKTVEGFVGAFLVTEVFAVAWGALFAQWNYMICPAVSLGMNAFSKVECELNPVFEWHYASLPEPFSTIATNVAQLITRDPSTSVTSVAYTWFFFHCLVFAAFASLIAPFGGFFASGFKRAFNIKDFGDSIPGHGGLTDRFDCQFLMGLFSYVLIREHHVTIGSVLQQIVQHLTLEEQKELYREVGRYLSGQGVSV